EAHHEGAVPAARPKNCRDQ
ncbi:unnamed protein product, partial [Peronospora farinosa]